MGEVRKFRKKLARRISDSSTPALTITHVGNSILRGYVSGSAYGRCNGLAVTIDDPAAVIDCSSEQKDCGKVQRIFFSIQLRAGVEIEEYQAIYDIHSWRFRITIRTIGSGRENLSQYPPWETEAIILVPERR